METVLGTETLYAVTSESLELTVTCTVDPTADDALPSFALGPEKAPAPATAFVDGEWSATWDATTLEARAITPLLGAGKALPITSGSRYSLWVKVTAGAETPAWICGTVICP